MICKKRQALLLASALSAMAQANGGTPVLARGAIDGAA